MGRTYARRGGTPFYRCGGCGQKTAYLRSTYTRRGQMVTAQCRYCGGYLTLWSHERPDTPEAHCAQIQRGDRRRAAAATDRATERDG